ncbi:hypothetical protein B6D29_02090 [Microgenomates bacterium UTCPR1]|nr:MAG: hypothetical protein B6D29_02090 [Microgenomates bacterium UTCPR1]
MKIGLLLPSLLASKSYESRIFAPKELFISLVNHLVTLGHQVFTYTSENLVTKGNNIAGSLDLENLQLYSVRDIHKRPSSVLEQLSDIRKRTNYSIDLVSRAIAHANKNNLDIIHVYSDTFSYYFSAFTKIPMIFTLHDPVFNANTFEFWRLKYFNKVPHISISKYQAHEYEEILNLNCVGTIYHGIELNKFRFSETSGDNMIMIGRFIPEKGFNFGLRLATEIKKPLHIASSSNYETTDYYNKEIGPYLNSPYVTKLGFLNSSKRDDVMGRAKTFLFPIQWEEAFGLVMIEAMACGTPVIAFARGAVPEVVVDGVTGFVINSSEDDIRGNFTIKKTGYDGLKEAAEKIYNLPESEYRKMRLACRQHVEKNFSADLMAKNYEKLYRQIIDKNKSS